jgi:hypothetical protein
MQQDGSGAGCFYLSIVKLEDLLILSIANQNDRLLYEKFYLLFFTEFLSLAICPRLPQPFWQEL